MIDELLSCLVFVGGARIPMYVRKHAWVSSRSVWHGMTGHGDEVGDVVVVLDGVAGFVREMCL